MLGEADLVDAARRRGLDEALHGFDACARSARPGRAGACGSRGSQRFGAVEPGLDQREVVRASSPSAAAGHPRPRSRGRPAPRRATSSPSRRPPPATASRSTARRMPAASAPRRARRAGASRRRLSSRTRLTVSASGSPGTAPSQPSFSAASSRSTTVVGDQRPRGVVDEDHGRVVGHLRHADAAPTRPASRRRRPRRPPCRSPAPRRAGSTGSSHPGGATTTIESIQRGRLQPLETLREERPAAQAARTPWAGPRSSRSPRPAAARTAQTDTRPRAPSARRSRPRSPWRSSSCRSRRWRGRRRARRRPRPRPSPWRT